MKKNQEEIYRYLHQQMDNEERQAFEQSLDQDTALRQQLKEEMEKIETDFVDWLSDEMLRKDIEEISAEIEAEEQTTVAPKLEVVERSAPRRLLPNWLKYAAAAAVVLLTTTFLYQYLSSPQLNTLALSEQFYQEYKPDFIAATKGVTTAQVEDFDKMKALLESDDPQRLQIAYNYFAAIPQTETRYGEAIYLKAHAAYLQKQYAGAAATFGQFITAFPDHRERPFADFYQSLALLGDEQHDQALQVLNKILATPGHPYQALAKKLKTELSLTN